MYLQKVISRKTFSEKRSWHNWRLHRHCHHPRPPPAYAGGVDSFDYFAQCCESGSIGFMFLDLQDPDPFCHQAKNGKKNFDSFCFCDFFLTFHL